MRQPSPRTYLLMSGVIAGTLVGSDLLRLVMTGRVPATQLRGVAIAAAGVLAAVGLSNQNTHLTLELAQRLERARSAGARDGQGQVVRFPQQVRPVR